MLDAALQATRNAWWAIAAAVFALFQVLTVVELVRLRRGLAELEDPAAAAG